MKRSRRRFLEGAGTAGIAAFGGLSMIGTAAAASYTIDSDLRQTADVTGGQLDAAVESLSPGSPLVGLGDTWIATQNEHDINAVYMAAHAALESAWGRSSIAQEKNNIYGFDARDICPAECADGYASFAQCVREVMTYIDAEYLTPSGNYYEGTSLRAMNVHYATDNQWAEKIASIMNDLAAELPSDGGNGGGGDGGSGNNGFSNGEQVKSTVDLNTRHRPGTESRVLETQPTGTTGEIMNGPVSEDGYTWWGVHWSDDVWGWSAGQYLIETGTSSGAGSGFSDGERITPTTNLNTRHRPGTESRVLDTMSPETAGEIMNGPVDEDGYTWWGVHWLDANIWGWSAGQYLESSSGGGGGETDLVWPMSGYITSPYGPRSSGFHGGVDIGHNGEIGTPIYAAHDGTAYTAYDSGGYGDFIYIVHTNGYETEYGHVNSFAISDGQTVAQGDHITGMGASGNATGPHVHFGIEQNNNTKPIPSSDGQTVTAGEGISKDYTGL